MSSNRVFDEFRMSQNPFENLKNEDKFKESFNS